MTSPPPAILLRQARRAARLSQAELASRVGSSQSAIARLERPGANPTVATLSELLRGCGRRLELRVHPRPVSELDESQLVERLALTPAQRLETFAASARATRRLLESAVRVDRG